MLRCESCDGILTKEERVCYQCGDPAPDHRKPAGSIWPLLFGIALIVSLGFTAYAYF
jgi:hypothetical protein